MYSLGEEWRGVDFEKAYKFTLVPRGGLNGGVFFEISIFEVGRVNANLWNVTIPYHDLQMALSNAGDFLKIKFKYDKDSVR